MNSGLHQHFLLIVGGICGFAVVVVFTALFLIYSIQYENSPSSYLSYPKFVCDSHSCGCPNIIENQTSISRIVGGSDAPPFIYPWLVALTDRYQTTPFCSGFLISSNVLLTAAHCLNNRRPNQIEILSKIHDLREFHGDRHTIDQWIIHSEYFPNDSLHLNDIALIKVKEPFSSDLQPCCLPSTFSRKYPSPKTVAVVGGWGKISSQMNNRASVVLQHVVMPIVDHRNSKCQFSIFDSDRQICAGYDNLQIDACSGDSGAPLLVVDHQGDYGHFTVAGIVSYGNKYCDASISSGVYTRVSFYVDWINSNQKFFHLNL